MVVKLSCTKPIFLSVSACVPKCNVFVYANRSRVRELTYALTCSDRANSNWEWCPCLHYWWFHPLRKHQAASHSLPKISCPSLFWLGLFWETQAVESEHGSGRTGVLPPSISLLRHLHLVSLLPCMVKRSHRARLEVIFSGFQRHTVVSEVS